MSNENNHQNLIVGAAVVAGILGTLSALAKSNRSVQGWTKQAKNAANHVLEKGDVFNKNMLLGGVTGGLVGAATALLLAPKAGIDLIKDLAHPFSSQEGQGRKRAKSHKSASSKAASKSKKSSSPKKGKAKTEANSSHKSSVKKKSPARKRTAKAAIKRAVEAPERTINEFAGT